MKKYIFPLFLSLATVAGFTSCSDDDDESPTISMSVNGASIENNSSIQLAKTTNDPKNTGSDLVTLSFSADCDINSIQVIVNNEWEKNVDVVSTDTVSYNKYNKENAPSAAKQLTFRGVLGEYTVKVSTTKGSATTKFTVKNADDESEYVGNGRYLSNKQLIKFDATGDTHEKTILGGTFTVDKTNNIRYLNGDMCEITEENFEKYSSDYGKGDFVSVAEKCQWSKKYNIAQIPGYFIYRSSNKYYLIKVISIDGNIMIAEVQY